MQQFKNRIRKCKYHETVSASRVNLSQWSDSDSTLVARCTGSQNQDEIEDISERIKDAAMQSFAKQVTAAVNCISEMELKAVSFQ